MAKVIIFGLSDFSLCFYQTLKVEAQHEVVAFTVTKEYLPTEKTCEGLPIVDFDQLHQVFDMGECCVALTIGYKHMNDGRKKIYESCKEHGYNVFTYISPNAMMYSNNIGEGAFVYAGTYIGPYVSIGKCAIIHMQVCVSHNISVGDFSYLAAGTVVGGGAQIGKNCFLGMNSTIRNEIYVGDRVLVGANSFVNNNAEDGLAYMGNPAINKNDAKSDFLIKFINNERLRKQNSLHNRC